MIFHKLELKVQNYLGTPKISCLQHKTAFHNNNNNYYN